MPNKAYADFCAKLNEQHLLRDLPKTSNIVLDFASNDYLGLSENPSLIQATQTAIARYGIGSKASRLILPQKIMEDFEAQVAKDKHQESALIFATGFQANISLLGALLDAKILGKKPLVFADRLNHASMHLGCQLANTKQIRYRHLDTEHLTFLLKKYKDSTHPKFILTESVFGMDGDIADLEKIVSLTKDHKAFLYVDEAHATGLFGEKGYGFTCSFGKEIDLSMGTFSKGLGGAGAYVASSKSLQLYFLNRCAGFIYSTAPSLAQVSAMQSAWNIVPTLQNEVKQLFTRAKLLRETLQNNGFHLGNSTSHIIPIILGSAQKALEVQQLLAAKGIWVGAIRPPSVPPQQSRLRICLTLKHSKDDIETLTKALVSVL